MKTLLALMILLLLVARPLCLGGTYFPRETFVDLLPRGAYAW